MVPQKILWFSHKINKSKWKIFIADPEYETDLWLNKKECVGMCLYEKRYILISACAPKNEWSSILLHEIAHARCRGLSEATVLNVENRLISALLPHWKPPALPVSVDTMLRRVRRRNRRRKCREHSLKDPIINQ